MQLRRLDELGLKPFIKPIRGGPDGSQLTFQGLPTPNLFTGGGKFHGKLEFNSRRGLEDISELRILSWADPRFPA